MASKALTYDLNALMTMLTEISNRHDGDLETLAPEFENLNARISEFLVPKEVPIAAHNAAENLTVDEFTGTSDTDRIAYPVSFDESQATRPAAIDVSFAENDEEDFDEIEMEHQERLEELDGKYDEEYEENAALDAGFDSADERDRFVKRQEEALGRSVSAESFVGNRVSDGGEVVDHGDIESSLRDAETLERNEYTAENDEGERIEVREKPKVDALRVVFTRGGHAPFDTAMIRTLFDSVHCEKMFEVFGHEYEIASNADMSEVFADFAIDEDGAGQTAARIITHSPRIMSFGGAVVVPGIGVITARVARD